MMRFENHERSSELQTFIVHSTFQILEPPSLGQRTNRNRNVCQSQTVEIIWLSMICGEAHHEGGCQAKLARKLSTARLAEAVNPIPSCPFQSPRFPTSVPTSRRSIVVAMATRPTTHREPPPTGAEIAKNGFGSPRKTRRLAKLLVLGYAQAISFARDGEFLRDTRLTRIYAGLEGGIDIKNTPDPCT